jgi:ADA HAT complex component 1
LWEGVEELRARLNKEVDEGKRVSCKDVEKVALVIRHFGLSGLGDCEECEEEDLRESGEDAGRKKRRL